MPPIAVQGFRARSVPSGLYGTALAASRDGVSEGFPVRGAGVCIYPSRGLPGVVPGAPDFARTRRL